MSEFTTIPEFIIYDNYGEYPDGEFVLYTKPPYWLGQVFKFENRSDMYDFLDKNHLNGFSRIMVHYNIACVCIGTLNPQSNIKAASVPQEIAEKMLDLYYWVRHKKSSDSEDYFAHKDETTSITESDMTDVSLDKNLQR